MKALLCDQPAIETPSAVRTRRDPLRGTSPPVRGEQPAGTACRSVTGEPPQLGDDGASDVAGVVRGEPVVVEELRREAAVAEGVAATVGARASGEEGDSTPRGGPRAGGGLLVFPVRLARLPLFAR